MTIYIFVFYLWAHYCWWSRAMNCPSDMGQLCFHCPFSCISKLLAKSCAGTWSSAQAHVYKCPTLMFGQLSSQMHYCWWVKGTVEMLASTSWQKVLSLALIFRLKCMRSSCCHSRVNWNWVMLRLNSAQWKSVQVKEQYQVAPADESDPSFLLFSNDAQYSKYKFSLTAVIGLTLGGCTHRSTLFWESEQENNHIRHQWFFTL